MKRLSVTLAFVLCLTLCVFAFASCNKEKKPAGATADVTAPATTTGETACEHEWGEFVIDENPTCTKVGSKSKYCTKCDAQDPASITEIPMIAHTPAEEYTVDTPATCSDVGYESIHCTVCKQPIADTVRQIDIDENAHVVEDDGWTADKLTLLNQTGTKTGTCTACGASVVRPIEYEGLSVWNANDKATGNKVDKRTYQSIRGEDHFYPDETNNNLGNDLLIEFSILYNETLASLSGATFDITVGDGSDFVNIKLAENANARYGTVVGGFSARDRNDGKGAVLSTPTAAEIEADPNAKYPSIGDYGWHRVGVRIHESADIVEDAVVYTLTGEVYLDGELILAFDLSKWAKDNKGALLYTATIENDQLVYSDNDATNAWGEFGIYDFYKGSNVYVGIADRSMTCGKTFVQQVEAVATPDAATYTLDDMGTPDDTTDDVTCPAAIYYKFIEA